MAGMLSMNEVADKLGVSRETVRRLILRKELRAVRIGRQWRVTEEDLAAYLKRAGTTEQES
jgi:excisionase family DNA binding protein